MVNLAIALLIFLAISAVYFLYVFLTGTITK